jgi:hypothetical protein
MTERRGDDVGKKPDVKGFYDAKHGEHSQNFV